MFGPNHIILTSPTVFDYTTIAFPVGEDAKPSKPTFEAVVAEEEHLGSSEEINVSDQGLLDMNHEQDSEQNNPVFEAVEAEIEAEDEKRPNQTETKPATDSQGLLIFTTTSKDQILAQTNAPDNFVFEAVVAEEEESVPATDQHGTLNILHFKNITVKVHLYILFA